MKLTARQKRRALLSLQRVVLALLTEEFDPEKLDALRTTKALSFK